MVSGFLITIVALLSVSIAASYIILTLTEQPKLELDNTTKPEEQPQPSPTIPTEPTVTLSLPITSFSLLGSTVTLSCSDNEGCKETKYCIDITNSCTPAIAYTGPFSVSGTGFVRYFSIDNTGNIEITKSSSFTVTPNDTIVPTGSLTGSPKNWQSTDASITLTCTDVGSGCDNNQDYYYLSSSSSCPTFSTTTYTAYTTAITVNSHKWFCYSILDKAGNRFTTTSGTEIKVDKNSPTSSITSPIASSTQSIDFEITVSDIDTGDSGLSSCFYSVDDTGRSGTEISAQTRTCSSILKITMGSIGTCRTAGTNTCVVTVWGSDVAGNIGSQSSRSFSITVPSVGILVKVLVLKYFPLTSDGKLDSQETWTSCSGNTVFNSVGSNCEISVIRTWVDTITTNGIAALEKGTKYKGHKNADAVAYLDYSIYDTKEFLKKVPSSAGQSGPAPPDHFQILAGDVDVCDYVDNKGVKQIWMWMYHKDAPFGTYPIESNMAMGTKVKAYWNFADYGDVSNSFRINDLPICQNTYTVFEYNYGRGLGEFIEDHGHQLEHVLNWVDDRDATPTNQWNTLLFWGKFVGSDFSHKIINPGCGWTHYAPNGDEDYDWYGEDFILSDCENWKPDGTGTKTQVNCHTWSGSVCTNDGGVSWKTWWMQNIPGKDSGLIYNGKALRNWWDFYGDFDNAIAKGKSLVS